MKYFKHFCFTILIIMMVGCEEKIYPDLSTEQPRLIVDATIDWLHGTTGNEQKIILTTSTGYFSPTVPTVSGATVFIKNSRNDIFVFLESGTAGVYACSDFIPEIEETYTLTVSYIGQTYVATETLKKSVPIDRIEQELKPGITSEQGRIDIRTYFTDLADEENYYLTRTQTSINAIPSYEVTEDRFFQGNQIYDLYQNEDLKPGNLLEISLYGITREYYNYMHILNNIAGQAGTSPFTVPPSTIRGNIINVTNPDNFVLGYFSLSESYKSLYLVK